MKTKIVLLTLLIFCAAAPAMAQNAREENPSEIRETLSGDVVADAMRKAMGADVAFINAGSLGSGDPGDRINRENLSTVVLFPDDEVVAVKLKGADIKAALEKSAAALPRRSSGFLQVSGVTFTADPNKKTGERVSNIKINGKPLDPEAIYRAALTDFLSSGGSGFTPFKNGKIIEDAPSLPIGDIVIKNAAITDAVRSAVGGRIAILPAKEE